MKPELADVATVITIVSGTATITHYTIKATHWAIQTYRARTRQPVYISGASGGSSSATATLTVGKSADTRWNVLQKVGKSIDLRWNVEAPTPSLARRLEELASWYLHVS